MQREVGHKWGTAATLGSLAWIALLQGDFDHATAVLTESIRIRREISDRGGLSWCFEKLAEIALLKAEFPAQHGFLARRQHYGSGSIQSSIRLTSRIMSR